MATFGGITLPMAVPDGSFDFPQGGTDASLDGALDVLGEAIPKILTKWLGDAWASVIQTNTPLINTVYLFDPTVDFDIANVVIDDNALPALFIFCKRGDASTLCDDIAEFSSEISFLWLPDSRQFADDRPLDALFRVFARAMISVVRKERDPAWVSAADNVDHPGEDAVTAARRVACRTFGSSIPDACGFSSWFPLTRDVATRMHFTIGTGTDATRYDGFLVRIHATEYSEDQDSDLAALGYVPTSLEQSLNTGGSDPLTTVSIVEPPEE